MGSVYFTYSIEPDLYYDIEGLDGTIQINLPIAISNAEDYALWFKIELIDPPADYTLFSQELGTLDTGVSGFFIFNFQRNLPTLTDGEFDEELTFRVTAYTNDEYSVEYGEKESVSTIHFFDSYDENWTMAYHDTFDDETVDGWNSHGFGCDLSSNHFLSAPYSCESTDNLYKSYTVGSVTKAYFVIHVYLTNYSLHLAIGNNLFIPWAIGSLIPNNKWIRLVFPIPVNASTNVSISAIAFYNHNGIPFYIDEIRVVTKTEE